MTSVSLVRFSPYPMGSLRQPCFRFKKAVGATMDRLGPAGLRPMKPSYFLTFKRHVLSFCRASHGSCFEAETPAGPQDVGKKRISCSIGQDHVCKWQ